MSKLGVLTSVGQRGRKRKRIVPSTVRSKRVVARRLAGAVRQGVWSLLLTVALAACSQPWNDPYPPSQATADILYTSFAERPKHMDPARSYSANEYAIIAQIYEPPLQYHYLKRPYTLIPAAASGIPEPAFLDAQGRRLPRDAPADKIAFSVYDIHIKKGIHYQPHPAFARDADGHYYYQHLTRSDLAGIHALGDFRHTGTRELTAADFVYQIKRLADPHLHSPIFGLMSGYIVGLADFAKAVQQARAKRAGDGYLDLADIPLKGVSVIDRYTYRIKIKGKYPQFRYWLAMPFFAPMAPEVDRFYAQPGMAERNITLDWYPVGTGPYMLTVNNPNLKMVLRRNPNFHGETYPSEGAPGDKALGLLDDAGKPLPFINEVMYAPGKGEHPPLEQISPGLLRHLGHRLRQLRSGDQVSSQGEPTLSDQMKKKGIQLRTAVAASAFYMGFNMLDDVVGGDSERARKLRQAISIAVD